jgi:hypothetical protein
MSRTIVVRFKYIKERGKETFTMLDRSVIFQRLNDLSPTSDCNISLNGTIKPIEDSKTTEQMGYYRAVIVPKFTVGFIDKGYNGWTDGNSHDFIKQKWFPLEVIDFETGESKQLPRSLAEASIIDLSKIIENCIIFADTYLNIEIPPPKKKWAKIT